MQQQTVQRLKYYRGVIRERRRQPKTMTQQEFFQQQSEQKKQVQQQVSDYGRMMEGIDPSAQYEYGGKVYEGWRLKQELEQTYGTELREAEQQTQLAWSQARDLPKGATVTRTERGYEIKQPDTSLEWTKKEFKKIEKAPPVVKQIAEFGFGATSSFAALGKPLAEGVAHLRGVKVKPVHYVSPLDIGFERIGWSPKGSSKILKERPIFTAGGVAGEYLQLKGFSTAFKGFTITGKGGKVLFKTTGIAGAGSKVIKKGIAQAPKFKRMIPTTVAKSPISKRAIGWATRGEQWGYKLVRKTKTPIVTRTLDKTGKKVVQVTKLTKGKRVWMTAEQLAKHKELYSKGSGLFKVTIEPVKYDLGTKTPRATGKVMVSASKKTFKPSLLRRGGTETYKLIAFEKDIGVKTVYKRSTTGLGELYNIQRAGKPVLESQAKGMRVYSKTGQFLGYKKVPTWQFQQPLKTGWKKIREPFIKAKQATVQLIQPETIQKPSLHSVRTRYSLVSPKTTIPASSFTQVPLTGLGYVPIKTVSMNKLLKHKPVTTTIPQMKSEHKSMTGVFPYSLSTTSTLSLSRTRMASLQKQEQDTLSMITQTSKQKSATKAVSLPTPTRTYTSSALLKPPLFYPKIQPGGRGRMYNEWDDSKKKYKFRKFKVPDIMKGFKL